MGKELRFALYAIKKNIQSSAELRTSFLMNIFGMAINNVSFVIIWLFFIQSVGVINGWGSADIVGLLGFGSLSYGIVYSIAAGIVLIPESVANGSFDRFLLSPKNVLLRIATSSFRVSALGDIFFGIVCLLLYALWIQASLSQGILILFLVLLSTMVFLGFVILAMSVSFFFTDAHAITNGLLDLFLTPSLFNGGIFQGMMRFLFLFVVPSLLLGAFPVEIVRNVSIEGFLLIFVLAFLWLFIATKCFFWGMRRYESSNLMTFGG